MTIPSFLTLLQLGAAIGGLGVGFVVVAVAGFFFARCWRGERVFSLGEDRLVEEARERLV